MTDSNSRAFHTGRDAKAHEIREIGFKAARDKFNMDNPRDQKPATHEAFHYAQGELDALLAALDAEEPEDDEDAA